VELAGWFALAPLFLLIRSDRSRRAIYLGSWLGGFAFWLLAVHWVWWTDPIGLAGLGRDGGVLSFDVALFLLLARFATRRLGLPLMIAGARSLVALEYLRAHGPTALPWYYLAHGQYRMIYLTQIADFSGALGLSFVIAVVNAFWVDGLTRPLFRPQPAEGSARARMTREFRVRVVVAAALVAGTLAYGAFRVASARFREGPRVAMLQSSEVQYHDSERRKDQNALLGLYESLILRAANARPRPDLIIWPETAFPFPFVEIDPKIDPKVLDAQAKQIGPDSIGEDWRWRERDSKGYFARRMADPGIAMMVGSSYYLFRNSGFNRYNSAILFQPGGVANQAYHKLHLVPFGEYVPLIDVFPWLMALTPYRGTRPNFLEFGAEPAWFRFGRYSLATAICFEDTLPQVVRRFFSESKDGRQPDLLVNLSNDGGSTRRPSTRCTWRSACSGASRTGSPWPGRSIPGISAVVDGNGRIVASLPKLKQDVLVASVPLDDRVAPYSRWGDWLGLSCLAATIGMVPLGLVRPRLRRRVA
jgi:apolipoprotein N-acyltransferase